MSIEENLKRMLGPLFFVSIAFLIVTYFIAMVLGPLVFFSTADGLAVSRRTIQRLPVIIFGAYTVVNVSVNVGLLFLLIWLVFLACFFVILEVRESVFVSFVKLTRGAIVSSFRNYLLFFPFVASFSFAGVLLLQLVQDLFGIPTGGPSMPSGGGSGEFGEFNFFLQVSYAPIVEEIGFRLIPIGVFLVVYLFLIRKLTASPQGGKNGSWRSLIVAPFYPDKAKKDCGLKSVDSFGFLRGISLAEWLMVVVTAAIFGLAHFPFGSWGPGKFLSATGVGVVLGVVYLTYGFAAPVLLHWFFNYYFDVFYLASNYFSRVVPLVFMVYFVNLLLGLFVWVALVYWFVRRFKKKPVGVVTNAADGSL